MNKKFYIAPAAETIAMDVADGIMLITSDTTKADPNAEVEVKSATSVGRTNTVEWESWE